VQPIPTPASPSRLAYAQRGTNTLQQAFRDHFKELGNFRMERISRVATLGLDYYY